ncbi:MAG: glycoside hydrolase family 28 protein [Treponema sp.]|jgi:polygalacturonase|nr:glycoside hydrolase family 28 protein [Treponema sp.]
MFNLISFGGKGDGIHDNSQAFFAALQSIKEIGGGTLKIEKGIWSTGPLELFSNTTLLLDEGAVISFIPEPERYQPVWTRWEGAECYAMHPLLFANEQSNITVSGKGILEGNGQIWWDKLGEKRKRGQNEPQTPEELKLASLNKDYKKQASGGGGRQIQFLRPPLVQFRSCSKITLEDITLRNSPFWTLHPLYCKDVVISGLKIQNPQDAPNTDGIDIDSCEDVTVQNCEITVGDDGIAIKSGAGEDGIRVGKPCRRITVRGCTVGSGHGGIVIGSETAAGISNVLTEDCVFKGTDRGIRIKTRRGRGGHIHNLEFRKLTMENNLCPLAINMFYRCGAKLEDGFFTTEALPVNDATPLIRDIVISDIQATGCRASAGFIAGLPESPIQNIRLYRCEFSIDEQSGINPEESEMYLGLPEVTEKSIRLINTKDIEFNEINVKGVEKPFIYQ